MRKTCSSTIKDTKKGMVKNTKTPDGQLNKEFRVVYDKAYIKDHIIYADISITAEKMDDDKIVSKVIFSGKKVLTSNVKREISRANHLWLQLVGDNWSPGKISISNGKDGGKAVLADEFLD